ncbi:signal transduction histidine kinase [Actinorugispora endophytica]|uniref:histidine kinase n=1 Tax=Actinorugispora endophytica TaxID=1605990 RepID=A0A4R6V136_9ACTN|nr:signal transduction histidine kinase [Actinorugispora endophytica]
MSDLGTAVRPLQGWPTRAEKVKDALLVLALVPLVVLNVAGMRGGGGTPALIATETVGAVLLLAVTVLLTRPYPLVALVVALLAVSWAGVFSLVLMVVAYLAGRRMPDSRPALVLFGAVATVGVPLVALVSLDEPESWITVVGVFAFNILFPWVVGMYRRQRRELALAGWERAERLEREQRIVADQARLRERSRIAQDMHDSLGHELSLIALRAGALEVAPDIGERVQKAAGELRENATTATERLREIIGVLRDDAEPVPMEPAGEDVSALVERARASGMAVTLIRRGDPAGLPHMADRAVYRIVQEALTNANKHAPGAVATVRLEHAPDGTLVRVSNTAPRTGPAPDAGGGRHGLIGLRERVRLAGGVLRAGGNEDGWLVEAYLPARPRGAKDPDGECSAEQEEQSRTTRYYRQAQRRVRWGLVALVGLPGTGMAVLVALAVGVTYAEAVGSTLPPERFDGLRVGQAEAEVRDRLPETEWGFYEPEESEDPLPGGWECAHYRSAPDLFDVDYRIYRLCFADGRLAAKEDVTP